MKDHGDASRKEVAGFIRLPGPDGLKCGVLDLVSGSHCLKPTEGRFLVVKYTPARYFIEWLTKKARTAKSWDCFVQ